MFYFWLVPVLLLAVVALFVWGYGGKRKVRHPGSEQAGTTEAQRRGQYLNKETQPRNT